MKYSIGIDLGTTNSALAFVPLDVDARSQVLPIPQLEAPGRKTEHDSLPSFLFLPGKDDDWIPGAHARQLAAERPDAVAHSAKSWLCHHAVDREKPILPWRSTEIPDERKLSPIAASARFLQHLREAWERAHPDAPFAEQPITVTVPASFDTVAQKLTLQAAIDAGYPDTVRLLEEPQAAFYRWLEAYPDPGTLAEKLPQLTNESQHVLVIDIGGGTSDFSLFELRLQPGEGLPAIKRAAVSDHILLGGDNLDLALAHLVEARLGDRTPGSLTGRQWNHLVARCRDLKERLLADESSEDEFTVAVPASGSGLVAGTLTANITREEIEQLVFSGFFPQSEKNSYAQKPRATLRELGLPYAADSAITRHLAGFLNGRPVVDAVLFNGGTLVPIKIRRRLVEQIAAWQDGREPVVLDNPEPALAVARGAAHYGSLGSRKSAPKISAGAARAIYLEVAGDDGRSLVCLLPRDTPPEHEVVIAEQRLQLQLNRRVEFQPWYSTRHESDQPGAVIAPDDTFHPLPPLHTTARLDGRDQILVNLHAQLNAVGLLTVACHSADPKVAESWPLEFDLQSVSDRPTTAASSVELPAPNARPELLSRATQRIIKLLTQPANRRDPVKPTALFKSLEKILDQPKHEWNGALVRALWPALDQAFDQRALSVEHEETWLNLAGFVLRPGCGAPNDDARIDRLWRLHQHGPASSKKNIRLQLYILWRRVAAGLSAERQTALIDPELQRLKESGNAPADLIRLAGSLERLDRARREDLAQTFISQAADLVQAGKHAADHFAALAGLLTRVPLYTGPENLLPPALVETAFEEFKGFDWNGNNATELARLFLRAARRTGDRQLDVSQSLSRAVQTKLEKSGVAPNRLQPLRQVIPVSSSELTQSIGESLPPGLALG